MTKHLPDHGTLSRHKHHGCQCKPCHATYRAYENRRNRLRGYGTWQPLVDAAPVRNHLANLIASGYTILGIATAAHTDGAQISRVLYGPSKKLRAETAARILNLNPSSLTKSEHRTIDGTGTRRRIQALVAFGWPLSHISRHTGIHSRRLTDLSRAQRVSIANARRVEAGYRRLSTMQPADHGVPHNQITTARRTAVARGWHGPLAWDDIDNPNEQPETDADQQVPRFLALAEDGLWLERTQGYTREQAAERLGVTKGNLQASISRARKQGHLELEEAA